MFRLYKFLIFFVLSIPAWAQEDTIFYNKDWDETGKELASYYRLKEKVKTSDTTYWAFKDFYLFNKQLQNEGFFLQNEYSDQEIRVGHWIWYYDNGLKKEEGDYLNNQLVGEWKYYHPNGKIQKVGTFSKKSSLNGLWVFYHPNEKLMGKIQYKNDTLVGNRTWYYDNGKIRFIEYYKKGRLDSIRKEWHANGNLKLETNFKGGFKDGDEKEFYLDGKIKSKVSYQNGILMNQEWYNHEGKIVPKDSVVAEKEFHNLLWKISGNGLQKPSYLFGTMHVKDKRAFEFSDSTLLAFKQCEGYSMEIHPDSLYAYTLKQFDPFKSWIHWGAEVLGPEHASDFRQDMSSNGNGYPSLVLNLNEVFHREDYQYKAMPYFLDVYLFWNAKRQGKYTDGIERVEDHIQAGKDLPPSSMKYDILSKINIEEEMMTTYQEGHLDKINSLMEFTHNEEFRYRLLTIRNVKMARSIDSLAKLRPTFNTAGTAHLPGKDGLIELLRNMGYTVTAVKANFTGDSLVSSEENQVYHWEREKPKFCDFSIESPERLISFNNGIIQHRYLDPVKERVYECFQFDNRWYRTSDKKNKIQDSELRYLFLDLPVKLDKTPIEKFGMQGLELIWENKNSVYNEDALTESLYDVLGKKRSISRYWIFKKNYQFYVLGVAALDRDVLFQADVEKFLNSFRIEGDEQLAFISEKLSLLKNGFEVEMPGKSSFFKTEYDLSYYDSWDGFSKNDYQVLPKQTVNYWSSKDNSGNIFTARVSTVQNENWENIEFAELSSNSNDYYREYLGEKYRQKENTVTDIEHHYKINKKYHFHSRLIQNGVNAYLLTARVSKRDRNKASRFFNSFNIIPSNNTSLDHQSFTMDSVKVLFPSNFQSISSDNISYFSQNEDQFTIKKDDFPISDKIGDKNFLELGQTKKYYYAVGTSTKKKLDVLSINQKYIHFDSISGVKSELIVQKFNDHFYFNSKDEFREAIEKEYLNSIDTLTIDSLSQNHYNLKTIARNVHEGSMTKKQVVYNQPYILLYSQFSQMGKDSSYIESNPIFPKSFVIDTTLEKIKMFKDLESEKEQISKSALLKLKYYSWNKNDSTFLLETIKKFSNKKDNESQEKLSELLNGLASILDTTDVESWQKITSQIYPDSASFQLSMLKISYRFNPELCIKKLFGIVRDTALSVKNLQAVGIPSAQMIYNYSPQQFLDSIHLFKHWYRDSLPDLGIQLTQVFKELLLLDKIDRSAFESQISFFYPFLKEDIGKTDIKRDVKRKKFYRSYVEGKSENQILPTLKLLALFPLKDSSVISNLYNLLASNNQQINFEALKTLFSTNNFNRTSDLKKYYQNPKFRYELLKILHEKNEMSLLDNDKRSAEAIQEAALIYAVSSSSRTYTKEIIRKVKLEKVVKRRIEGEEHQFHIFSYYNESFNREKYLGVINPMVDGKFDFSNEIYLYDQEFDKLNRSTTKRLINNWLEQNEYRDEDAGNYDIEGLIEEVNEAVERK